MVDEADPDSASRTLGPVAERIAAACFYLAPVSLLAFIGCLALALAAQAGRAPSAWVNPCGMGALVFGSMAVVGDSVLSYILRRADPCTGRAAPESERLIGILRVGAGYSGMRHRRKQQGRD